MIFMRSLENAHERRFHDLLLNDDLLSISKFLALKKMTPENVKFFESLRDQNYMIPTLLVKFRF